MLWKALLMLQLDLSVFSACTFPASPKISRIHLVIGSRTYLCINRGYTYHGGRFTIIYEAIKRLYEPTLISKLDIGILICCPFGGLFNYLMAGYSISIDAKHNSIALIVEVNTFNPIPYSTIGLVLDLRCSILQN